jgi:acyl carrier protein
LVSVGLVADLGDWLDYELDPAAPNDFPSIQSLARELAADERVRAAYLRRIGRSS